MKAAPAVNEAFVRAVLKAASALRNELDSVRSRQKLSTGQWVILKALRQGPRRQRQLAKLAAKDSSTITRTLDLLVRRKRVTRKSR